VVAIFESTLRALMAPRRLIPLALVAATLALVQAGYSADARAPLVPLAMTLAFVVVAPAAWRLLVAQRPGSSAGLAAYAGSAAAVVLTTGWLLPRALALGPTFLTDAGSLLVAGVLYLTGGWGLGRDIELEQDLQHARLQAMRAHLDPHFLYNTLNAIAEWCREDAAQAETAIVRLSALLAGVFAGLETRRWPLGRELHLIEDFVALHRVRDPGAVELHLSAGDAAADVLVPPLALLALAENAVKHGAGQGHRGTVTLAVAIEDTQLRITLENPGPYQPAGDGRGLRMLRRQLHAAYGARARLQLVAAGPRTRATMTLPRSGPR
jgi:hypothetical protein